MTLEHAEQTLKAAFPDASETLLDDMETYLVGKDDPEDYFSKIETTKELLDDFGDFIRSGYPTEEDCNAALEACRQESMKPAPHIICTVGEQLNPDAPRNWTDDQGRAYCWNVVEEPIFESEFKAAEFAKANVGPQWMVIPVGDLSRYYVENRLTGARVLTLSDAFHELYNGQ